ncbi:potassium-transporting ATPase subunit KdpC [Anaeromyxobacter paludicola]|uniref:Potassium-transporting ATPase KdpC subunit n=1 Tax=Anaeromyxobacter paludicola TaxID=2918171 RepID=A0ABM7XAJ8_9BACT|nr:potassium-transporting ATPase subunit KdpC [Anaeromyxobacter paludicola]BDG08873.1 potassium-transporting ATPase KdpC subunit [Anaeromyxobacter paludicola]
MAITRDASGMGRLAGRALRGEGGGAAGAGDAPAPVATGPGPRRSALRDALAPAVRATIVTLVLTGLAYPLAVTVIARGLFPARSAGSFAADASGKVVGSELLAQPFAQPGYFHPRPSAAGDRGYDAASSGGSNLGPTSKKLREQAAQRAEALTKENPEAAGPVPVELVTASGSGLDPHLSPEAALWQAPRVAAARRVSVERIRALVADLTEGRALGVLGEPRVNVLLLNLELDRRLGPGAAGR